MTRIQYTVNSKNYAVSFFGVHRIRDFHVKFEDLDRHHVIALAITATGGTRKLEQQGIVTGYVNRRIPVNYMKDKQVLFLYLKGLMYTLISEGSKMEDLDRVKKLPF